MRQLTGSKIIHHLFALLSGTVFALGLGISGMTQPSRVIGFLNVTGMWDPTLVFVLASAVGTYLSIYFLYAQKRKPIFTNSYALPEQKSVDAPLVGGAATFGIGWGLAGFCPGPAIVAVFSGAVYPLLFVGAMAAGMLIYNKIFALNRSAQKAP